MKPPAPVPCCILAGGRATRMGGGDKCRLFVAGRPVIAHLLDALRPQVGALAINANGDAGRFRDLGLPVLADAVPNRAGPLAGVLAGLDWAAGLGAAWLLTVPGDTPFVPGNLLARLMAEGGPACAASGGRAHPAVAVWPASCREDLRRALAEGHRRAGGFVAQRRVEWPVGARDPFANLNTPEDLAAYGSDP